MQQMDQQWPGKTEALEGTERFELKLPERPVQLREREGRVELSANLGAVPTPVKEDFLRHLMRGNLLGQGTGGAALGTDAAGKELKLVQRLSGVNGYGEFVQRVEEFVNYADYWAQELEKNGR
jgi:hypothetical protein